MRREPQSHKNKPKKQAPPVQNHMAMVAPMGAQLTAAAVAHESPLVQQLANEIRAVEERQKGLVAAMQQLMIENTHLRESQKNMQAYVVSMARSLAELAPRHHGMIGNGSQQPPVVNDAPIPLNAPPSQGPPPMMSVEQATASLAAMVPSMKAGTPEHEELLREAHQLAVEASPEITDDTLDSWLNVGGDDSMVEEAPRVTYAEAAPSTDAPFGAFN